MDTISWNSSVVAAPEQISSDLGGEAVILNLKAGVYYGLDAVGARIWQIIQKPAMVGEIRAALLEEYDVEADRCAADLLALLTELSGEGLIEVKDEAPA